LTDSTAAALPWFLPQVAADALLARVEEARRVPAVVLTEIR
jgi:hypothetical protein